MSNGAGTPPTWQDIPGGGFLGGSVPNTVTLTSTSPQLTIGTSANAGIITQAAASGTALSLTLRGALQSSGTAGAVVVLGGESTSVGGTGGAATLQGGPQTSATGSNIGGEAAIRGGAVTTGTGGAVTIYTTPNTSANYANRLTVTASGAINANGPVSSAINAVAASTIDMSLGNYFTKTATGALTWTFSNPPASRSYVMVLKLTNGGLGAQTWPAAVKWPAFGSGPALSAAGTDILMFMTDNGGTTYYGSSLIGYA